MAIVRPPKRPGGGLDEGFGVSKGNVKRGTAERHLIDDIRFRSEDPELNYITCTCSWKGLTTDFQQHRKDMGVVRK